MFESLELSQEYSEIDRRLQNLSGVREVDIRIGKGAILVELRVIAAERTRRAVIQDGSIDIYRDLNDDDMALCAQCVANVIDGLHFKSRVGYKSRQTTGEEVVTYYIAPDWKWWYARVKKQRNEMEQARIWSKSNGT